MSTHPNAILLLVLTPDDLARKTYRAILAQLGNSAEEDVSVDIAGNTYHSRVMEDDYYEGAQIGANEGDIVFWDYVTYGYGERIEWAQLEQQKQQLEEWAKGICEQYRCSYKIYVTANYW